MRFKVPQFIDIEDKIFGPFTFKQFMYLAGGVGISYVLYTILPIYVALPLIIVVGGLSFALTFVQINKKPFIYILEAWFKYVLDSKMFIWKKVDNKNPQAVAVPKTEMDNMSKEKLSNDRLQKLAWGLNIIKEEE